MTLEAPPKVTCMSDRLWVISIPPNPDAHVRKQVSTDTVPLRVTPWLTKAITELDTKHAL